MEPQALVFKYVMFVRTRNKERTDGVHLPVIFPTHIMHSDMGDAIRGYGMSNGYQDNHYHQRIEPISAGFINLSTLQCFGKSDSLELESRPEDSQIIAEYMQTEGAGAKAPIEDDA